jgi:Outer membrane protein beta-barrel domain
MKTTILLAFSLLLNYQTLFAQSHVSIGLIGGPMAVNFREQSESFQPKKWMPTFSIGTAVRVNLKYRIFFQTEALFERKGFSLGEIQWTDFNANIIGTSTPYNYFDYASLTPAIGFSSAGKVHFESSLGIFFGYFTDIKTKFVNSSTAITTPNWAWDMGTFNRFDVGATSRLGIGFDVAKKWALTINAIGNLGFAKPYKSVLGAPTDYGRDKTVSLGFQFGVFYKI